VFILNFMLCDSETYKVWFRLGTIAIFQYSSPLKLFLLNVGFHYVLMLTCIKIHLLCNVSYYTLYIRFLFRWYFLNVLRNNTFKPKSKKVHE
jgi:hypothetical protein